MSTELTRDYLTAERLKEYTSKHVITLEGKAYGIIDGYPKFAFWYDEVSKKFSIANLETDEVTEPFCDEIIYSELPLETWTANYVVVRIGSKYSLADNNGNCFFESNMPFHISRNLFVSGDYRYIINQNMKQEYIGSLGIIVTKKGYKLAVKQLDKKSEGTFSPLDADGFVLKGEREGEYDFSTIDNWVFQIKIIDKYIGEIYDVYYIDERFKVIHSIKDNYKDFGVLILGEKSMTYDSTFSRYFNASVKLKRYGKLEVVWYDGKTYFFKPNGKITTFDYEIQKIRFLGDCITYRNSSTIYQYTLDGRLINKSDITIKEAYWLDIFEGISDKLNTSK